MNARTFHTARFQDDAQHTTTCCTRAFNFPPSRCSTGTRSANCTKTRRPVQQAARYAGNGDAPRLISPADPDLVSEREASQDGTRALFPRHFVRSLTSFRYRAGKRSVLKHLQLPSFGIRRLPARSRETRSQSRSAGLPHELLLLIRRRARDCAERIATTTTAPESGSRTYTRAGRLEHCVALGADRAKAWLRQ